MSSRALLTLLFIVVLLSMLAVTSWATLTQPIWEWTALKEQPNHAWTIATLVDAYFGFLTFYVWVFYKERRVSRRIGWLIAILGLGNIAMAIYMLIEARKLKQNDGMEQLLVRRHD